LLSQFLLDEGRRSRGLGQATTTTTMTTTTNDDGGLGSTHRTILDASA
jgi:hypothetical protein